MTNEELEEIKISLEKQLRDVMEGKVNTPSLQDKIKDSLNKWWIDNTYITAGELRERGITLDSVIPDYATVPISSIESKFTTTGDTLKGRIDVSIAYKFNEPFTWME